MHECDHRLYPWHALAEEDVLQKLACDTGGLSEDEAARRLESCGPNTLPAKKPPTIWMVLLSQILNPLIFVLIGAAVASVAIGDIKDAIFILLVIALNSGLGAYQEFSAEKSAASLQSLLRIRATVRRGSREQEIPSEDLVPGDIVLLESGAKVPADLRILQSNNLTSDESFLTGESVATEKRAEQLAAEAAVSDRSNMAFAGAVVASGRGLGVVVATGADTQVGQIAESVATSEHGKPPLVVRMERFIRVITMVMGGISVVLATLLWHQGSGIKEIFFFVVALAVSAIPEGLPVAMTVALSVATRRMSQRNVIVRKLTAVESLGSCTVIASDKTGTLTVNEQTVRRVVLADGVGFSVSGEGYNGEGEVSTDGGTPANTGEVPYLEHLARLSILANEATLERSEDDWKHRGDAMDVALLALGYKLGLNPTEVRGQVAIRGEIPYESEQKFSAVFYETDGVVHVAVKGAVETILGFCSSAYGSEGTVAPDREGIERMAESMAEEGLRVLAVAGGPVGDAGEAGTYGPHDLSGLTFCGLAGFIDPLRPEAIEAVATCKRAGIRVLMITGDHPATAGAIARSLGLAGAEDPVVTGRQLSDAGDPEGPQFSELVRSSNVFARVSPNQKLEIVDALIDGGEFVAVTGDGVNDAPALRRANIGVAMGSGTDVAKEVGSMIAVDDNFASIVAGVEEGRFAYSNVRKVIYLLISTGAAEVVMFTAAVVSGLPIPLLAVQLLWLNLVTNGIQDVALAFEGGEPGAMKRPPRRPNERIFNPLMTGQTVASGLTIGAVAFAVWYWLVEMQGFGATEAGVTSARNIVLLVMVLFQNVHVFNCRSEYVSAFGVPIARNPILVLGVLIAQGIHILSMQLPFMQRLLRTESLQPMQWLWALGLALSVLLVMEVFKLIARSRGGGNGAAVAGRQS